MGGGWGCGGGSFPTRPSVDQDASGSSWYDVVDQASDAVNKAIEDAKKVTDDIDTFPVGVSQPEVSQEPGPVAKKQVPWEKMTVDPVVIQGELQQLAAGRHQVGGVTEKGCFAVSGQSGQFGKAPQLTLSFVSAAGKATVLQQIPDAFDPETGVARFQINSLFQNQAGNIVYTLQSTDGYSFTVDGSVHQILVTDSEGKVVGQHDFMLGLEPNYRPQVVAENAAGEQFVLLNNCDPAAVFINGLPYVPCNQDSAVAVFQTPDFSDSPKIIPLNGVKNGGAMALAGDQLVIAAAGNVNVDPKSVGQLLSLNLAGLGSTLPKGDIMALPGVGLGSTQLAFRNGSTLFTANNSSWAPASAQPGVVLLENQQTRPIPLPAKLVFVAGAVFAGDEDVLFNGHHYDAQTKLATSDAYRAALNTATGTPIPLQNNAIPAQFSIGVVEYDEFSYCYGAAGTGKSVDGVLASTVMMVRPSN